MAHDGMLSRAVEMMIALHFKQEPYGPAWVHLASRVSREPLSAWSQQDRKRHIGDVGGNVVRRDLGKETMMRISRYLKESIRYGLEHRADALAYALQYARDMDTALADRFVGMYVNDWTLDYGPRGREAVRRLLEEGHRAGIIPGPVAVEFVA